MHQLCFRGTRWVGIIVKSVFGLVRFGGGVREIIMHKQPAELDTNVLFSEGQVGQVADDVIAVLNAVGSTRGTRRDGKLVVPSCPRRTEAGRDGFRPEWNKIGGSAVRRPDGENRRPIGAVMTCHIIER